MNPEAANFEAIHKAIQSHGQECSAPPTGIEMSFFDIERMGWEEGDIICGLPLVSGAQAGMLRILCDGLDDGNNNVEEEEIVNAVSNDNRLVTV